MDFPEGRACSKVTSVSVCSSQNTVAKGATKACLLGWSPTPYLRKESYLCWSKDKLVSTGTFHSLFKISGKKKKKKVEAKKYQKMLHLVVDRCKRASSLQRCVLGYLCPEIKLQFYCFCGTLNCAKPTQPWEHVIMFWHTHQQSC